MSGTPPPPVDRTLSSPDRLPLWTFPGRRRAVWVVVGGRDSPQVSQVRRRFPEGDGAATRGPCRPLIGAPRKITNS